MAALHARSANGRVKVHEGLNFGGPNFDIEDYSFVNIAAEYEVNPYLSPPNVLRFSSRLLHA